MSYIINKKKKISIKKLSLKFLKNDPYNWYNWKTKLWKNDFF